MIVWITIIFKKAKVRAFIKNQSVMGLDSRYTIHEAPPGLSDDIGKEFCLKFIKSNGNYKYLYAEGRYGSVWHCIEHSNCQNRYRVGQCKKHRFWKVSANNKAHSSGMIQLKSGIQINIKNEVSSVIFYLLFLY